MIYTVELCFCCLFLVSTERYHIQFKITSKEYTTELADADSVASTRLASDLNSVVCQL